MPKLRARAVFAARLKAVRTAMDISQAELGLRSGLPPEVASTRINRYERGIHLPDIETAEKLAQALGVPLAYLLAQDERLAEAILKFDRLPVAAQNKALAELDALGKATKEGK
ncbi:MAG: XRE family transcriptional regulator [Stenotrophomonas acidaminiphila]|nr:MAG: XRE family transcriptional regulator [Stenotrophomonas acidaminiphila]